MWNDLTREAFYRLFLQNWSAGDYNWFYGRSKIAELVLFSNVLRFSPLWKLTCELSVWFLFFFYFKGNSYTCSEHKHINIHKYVHAATQSHDTQVYFKQKRNHKFSVIYFLFLRVMFFVDGWRLFILKIFFFSVVLKQKVLKDSQCNE